MMHPKAIKNFRKKRQTMMRANRQKVLTVEDREQREWETLHALARESSKQEPAKAVITI